MTMDDLNQVGPPTGINPGGLYQHRGTGEQYYVKWSEQGKKQNRIKNEMLAAKLYELAGVKVPQTGPVNLPGGGIGLASRIIPNLRKDPEALMAGHKDIADGFAADAWLGNWDAVGIEYNNMLHGGESGVHRVDVGGALMYRATGEPKGPAFGNHAQEITSLRDPNVNPAAASVYGRLTPQEVDASITRVMAIPDGTVRQYVMRYGPGDEVKKNQLADKLIARKHSLGSYMSKREHGAGPVSPSLADRGLPLSPQQ